MGQAAEPPDLAADVAAVLALAAHQLHGLHIGLDDGQGRFQLMARVGDELALALHVLRDGADGPTAQRPDQHQHGAPGQHSGQSRKGGGAAHRAQLLAHVQKDAGAAAVSGLHELIFQIADAAVAPAIGGGLQGQGSGPLLVHGGDAAQVHALYLVLAVQPDHEVQGGHAAVLGQRLPEEAAPRLPAEGGVLAVEVPVEAGGGAKALLHGQGGQQPVALPGLGQGVKQVHGAQHHRQQHGDGDHGRDHEFFLQRLAHACPSGAVSV